MTRSLARIHRRRMRQATGGLVIMHGPDFPSVLRMNGGLLPDSEDMMWYSFAAWYFCKISHETIHNVTRQVSYEGDVDLTVNLKTLLDSVILIYGTEDIDKLMALIPLCRQQAFRFTLPWNDRFQAWVDSAGRAYNEVTREPDSFSQSTT